MQLDANSIPTGVGMVALNGGFLWGSDRLKNELGLAPENPLNFTFQDITYAEDLDDDLRNVERLLSGASQHYKMEKRYVIDNRDPFWVDLSVQIHQDESGKPEHFSICVKNIDDHKRKEQLLRDLAYVDQVSGLANRNAFLECANKLMSQYRTDKLLVFGVADINELKPINDNFGHAAGDLVISYIAQELKEIVGKAGLVARLGGDEFGIILSQGCPQAIHLLNAGFISTTREIFGRKMTLSASVGFSVFNSDSRDLGELLKLADQRMYDAKETGGFATRNKPRFISTV